MKRRNVFTGITLTQESGGTLPLLDAGVNKLHPLISEGEKSGGWTGSSWGFVFVKDRVMLSNGTLLTPITKKLLLTGLV